MASHCCRYGRPRTVTIFEKEQEIFDCRALFVTKSEFEATQFAFVCPCLLHLHGQVAVLYGRSYITNCRPKVHTSLQ